MTWDQEVNGCVFAWPLLSTKDDKCLVKLVATAYWNISPIGADSKLRLVTNKNIQDFEQFGLQNSFRVLEYFRDVHRAQVKVGVVVCPWSLPAKCPSNYADIFLG